MTITDINLLSNKGINVLLTFTLNVTKDKNMDVKYRQRRKHVKLKELTIQQQIIKLKIDPDRYSSFYMTHSHE